MTDHQFDAMIEMAIQLIRRADSIEDAIESLNAVKRGHSQNGNETAQKRRQKNSAPVDSSGKTI